MKCPTPEVRKVSKFPGPPEGIPRHGASVDPSLILSVGVGFRAWCLGFGIMGYDTYCLSNYRPHAMDLTLTSTF